MHSDNDGLFAFYCGLWPWTHIHLYAHHFAWWNKGEMVQIFAHCLNFVVTTTLTIVGSSPKEWKTQH